MRENTDQKNSEHGQFLRSAGVNNFYNEITQKGSQITTVTIDGFIEKKITTSCSDSVTAVHLEIFLGFFFKLLKLCFDIPRRLEIWRRVAANIKYFITVSNIQ